MLLELVMAPRKGAKGGSDVTETSKAAEEAALAKAVATLAANSTVLPRANTPHPPPQLPELAMLQIPHDEAVPLVG